MTSIIKVDTLQKANGATPTAADLGINTTGTVLQVVKSSVITTQFSINSTNHTEINTGFRVAITPKSTSSTIIWMMCGHFVTAASVKGSFEIRRSIGSGGFNNIQAGNGQEAFRNRSSTTVQRQGTVMYYDDPNTTSDVIYTPYFWRESGTDPFIINDNGMGSFCMALEIAG
ncbi:hypothetical protein N9I36_00470 [Planktomarina temperata]|nr:hypothetical protein [Planktomarina temperata]